MLHNKKVVVVLPAYKAAKTLRQTYAEIPRDIVEHKPFRQPDARETSQSAGWRQIRAQ